MLRTTLLLSLRVSCSSRLVNITVDDYPGAVPMGATLTYAPDGDWLPLPTAGDTSTYKIDYSRVHGGTLHTGPWPDGNMTLTFVGTMIYLFFVLDAGWNNDLFFYLDGAAQPSGSFHRPGDESVDVYLYNQLVHQSGALAMGKHSLRMAVSSIPRIFFDFAVFTTTEEGDASDGAVPSRGSTDPPLASGPSASSPSGTPVSPTSGTALPEAGPPGVPEAEPQSGTRTSPSRTTTSTGNQAQTSETSDHATAVRTTRSSSGSKSETRSPDNVPAVVGASIAGAVVVATLCACIIRRRRRRSQLAVLVPFDTPPAPHVPRGTASLRRESAENADREETSFAIAPVPPREKFRRHQADASFAAPQLAPSASSEYSDSDGTRAELERVRGENERVLAEMEMLRQAGTAPPAYSDLPRQEYAATSGTR